MSVAVLDIDGEQITLGNDGYGIWDGSSSAEISKFARTVGGYIKPSKRVDKTVDINTYQIFPDNFTRVDVETFFNLLNDKIATKKVTMTLSGNVFPNCFVRGITYDQFYSDKWVKFNVDILVGNQDDGGIVRQIDTPEIFDFSRGRKASFHTRMEDGSVREFRFWHNIDSVRNLDVDITEVDGGRDGRSAKIVATGGMERIICDGWFVTFSNGTRKDIEAYLFNMINGPLGRVGTLCIEAPKNVIGQNVWQSIFLENISQGSDLFNGSRYTLTFLSPLQC